MCDKLEKCGWGNMDGTVNYKWWGKLSWPPVMCIMKLVTHLHDPISAPSVPISLYALFLKKKVKWKVKLFLCTQWRHMKETKHRSTSSQHWHLLEVHGQFHGSGDVWWATCVVSLTSYCRVGFFGLRSRRVHICAVDVIWTSASQVMTTSFFRVGECRGTASEGCDNGDVI